MWPGVVAALGVVFALFVVPVAMRAQFMYGMFGGIGAGLAIAVWWVFFSRAPWTERLGAVVVGIVALLAVKRVVDPSVAGAGMGMMLPLFGIPIVSLGLVAGALVGRRFAAGPRRAAIAAGILLGSSAFAAVRTGGITGDGVSDLHWRWTKTPEQLLLVQAHDEPKLPAAPAASETPEPAAAPAVESTSAPAATVSIPGKTAEKTEAAVEESTSVPTPTAPAKPAEWPGFRGPDRDSVIRGVQIETDWSARPPVQLWRRPIGPGWSSFAVDGDLFYTQEQRGDEEIVAAYHVTSGEPVWRHRDTTRFYESNGGAGPRGTPSLSDGRVYTVGATGIVNALNARTGTVLWSRNLGADAGKKVPGWGFASSPLVISDLVVVAATGTLVAYDRATGKPRWFGPKHAGGYTSPHRLTRDGADQIVLLTADGITSVAPSSGKLLWEHPYPGVPIVQPAVTAEGDILLSTGDSMGGNGIKRIAIAHTS
ncbi:MAG: hypothetical protein C5B48_11440, partial [Candidatus Rokuibacteriota bacterium]